VICYYASVYKEMNIIILNMNSAAASVYSLPWQIRDKCKDIPVTGCGSPVGCETSRPLHFLDSHYTVTGEVVNRTCQQAALYPQEDSGTCFC
jgi:hypothetical protein